MLFFSFRVQVFTSHYLAVQVFTSHYLAELNVVKHRNLETNSLLAEDRLCHKFTVKLGGERLKETEIWT